MNASITPTATENNPKRNVGSAMAALLAQVPAELAEQIQDAYTADLIYVSGISLDAGQRTVLEKSGFTTTPKQCCQRWCVDHDREAGVCRHETVYVDFTTSGQTPWGSVGLTSHPDETPQMFLEFPGTGATFATPADMRPLLLAALKVADDAIGGA